MRPDPEWTAGPPNIAPGGGLHEAFSRRARERPGAIALVDGDRALTYAELDAVADAWAAGLAAAGVSHGDRVPIQLPRSTELVVALLAVLKAGAAYCLLPPDWPEERTSDVLSALRPPLLVAAADGASAGYTLLVWSPPTSPAVAPVGFQPATVDAAAPCCVFFTSGTTGRPKGVVSPHRATARLFQPGGFARFTGGTVMPLAAPTPWDAFSLELWSVLLNGGCAVIVTDPYLSPTALTEGVSRHGMDTVWCTASLFNLIVDETPDAFNGLRQVLIGGERLSVPHVRRFLRHHPDVVLMNGYGPVECTVFATTHRITEADCDLPGGIPLGRPVPGTQVYVLDSQRECLVGETGEICLGGDGLALEYLGDPALTEEKFPHVRVDGQDTRVYRTGDLGRWGADGLLHLEGRADRQLKIRGHRVEPAEVERQVERLLPAVRHCRVVPRGDAARGERELLAFCIPARPSDPLSGALATLHGALVPYHRLAAAVSVDAFPLTPQGKLDERALLALAPAQAPNMPASRGTRPGTLRDPLLRAVAEGFATLLETNSVPLDVPFVELGGTSLKAGRLCARLSARLARPVPVAWLYEHPSVAGFTARLAAGQPGPDLEESAEAAVSSEVPLSPVQTMQLTRQLLDPTDRTGHCLLTWVVEGELDQSALVAAIAAVHERHEPLRAAYRLDPRPGAHPTDIPPPVLEELPPEPSVDAALASARSLLGGELLPEEGEVWRTVLVPVKAGAPGEPVSILGCVVHHVAFDGWSEGVLADDLATAYESAASSSTGSSALSPQPSMTALSRRAQARRRLAASELHLSRLRAELAGVPPIRWPGAPLPGGPGRIDAARPAPGRIEVVLPPSTLAAVDGAAAATGVTRFVVLLTLWATSLAEVTGQWDFAVGVPVAQRDDPGLEDAIGCHITMLCLRLRDAALQGDRAAIEHTARIVRQALAAQEVPLFDVLDVAAAPGPGQPPLYQTLFAYQDNALPRLALPGARTTFVRQPYLDLPLELHAELWPEADGQLRLEVAFRPDAVAEETARDAVKLFTEHVHHQATGAL
ncbi:amino acid adenylation domain-containing protein [Streptomyces lunalinharesii]|uniref:amino acid adenylation domain-containing protein n=1 Tax=Streptomyces lunalinharesii TaxID=333384 RepID=UPI0031D6F383